MTHNVLALGEGGELEVKMLNSPPKFHRINTAQN